MTEGEIIKLAAGTTTYLGVSLVIFLALMKRIDKLIAIVGRIAEKKTSPEKDPPAASDGEKDQK